MKIFKCIIVLSIVISTIFSSNAFAMNYDELLVKTPKNEVKHEDRAFDYGWVWLSDDLCAQFKQFNSSDRGRIQRMYDLGATSHWYENGQIKKRDTYNGKWSQSESGIWSFVFDDYTVPVGITKIDGVLYAFSGYGELIEGYEYYSGLKTGADGLVTSDNPEFLEWMKTQYVPDCTTTKTE